MAGKSKESIHKDGKIHNNSIGSKFFWWIVISLLGATLIILSFFTAYGLIMDNSYNDYEKSIKNSVSEITKLNESTSSLISGQTINEKKAEKLLPALVDNLQSIDKKLQKLTPTSKYKANHYDLVNGLENNINLYKQMLLIIKNQQAKDIGDSLKNIQQFANSCSDNYSKINIDDIKIAFPDITNKFTNNFINFTNKVVEQSNQNEITSSQSNDFINKITDLENKYQSIKVDFKPYVTKIRSGNGTYDDLIANINKSQNDISSLKLEFSNLTVPQNGTNIFKTFKKLLDDYDLYVQNFKFNVETEQSYVTGGNKDNNTLNNLYKTTDSKLLDLSNEYSDLTKAIEQYKK